MTAPLGPDDIERSWVRGASAPPPATGTPAETGDGRPPLPSVQGFGADWNTGAAAADAIPFDPEIRPTPVAARGRHEKPTVASRLRSRDGIILVAGAALAAFGLVVAIGAVVARQRVPNRTQALAALSTAQQRLAADRRRLDASNEPAARLDTLVTTFATQVRDYQANAAVEAQKNQALIDAFVRGDVAAYNALVAERNTLVQTMNGQGAAILATLSELTATAGELPRPSGAETGPPASTASTVPVAPATG